MHQTYEYRMLTDNGDGNITFSNPLIGTDVN